MQNPLQPSEALMLKLGAVVVRAYQFVEPSGSMHDLVQLQKHLADPEVLDWIAQMRRQLHADPPLVPRMGMSLLRR
jgi:hypothetical protein